ncbi:MAG TPA: alpha-L-arabinofuranosidase C-terminal domain-containing protein, partial [Draconibacterium sp.]|nr:alpha-L-arabinofuranosidase C-terminal domain-containing protein [Draconibacterium sp.]
IYGVFMEPIRNTMDGLLYDPDHPLANEHGFRTDFIDVAKELQLTNMRWPGGNYTLTYDWKDGIGPVDDRPVRRELAWNVLDRNRVGTDEWLELAKEMGVESSICINVSTASLMDNKDWIEYVNSPMGSYYADLRAENGHPQPYGVKYWHLGNEVEGEPWQAIALNSQEYVTYAKDAATIMYFVNRGCESCMQPTFIAMGSSWVVHEGEAADWAKWNWDVIDGLITQRNVEYIALHRYWGAYLTEDISNDMSPNVYLGDWAEHLNDYITTTKNQIEIAKVRHNVMDKPFHIAFTEWAPRGGHLGTLAGALHFNTFIRNADAVKRANYTMFTSLLSQSANGETYKSPFFYMFKLFSVNVHGKALDTYVDCEKFDGKVYQGIPYLDVSSSYSEEEKALIINIVNRNMNEAISTTIISDTGEFRGVATVSTINSDNMEMRYSYEEKDNYLPKVSSVTVDGKDFDYSFPPHSFTQIKVALK